MAQYLCSVQHVFTIPGRAFVPKPEVRVYVCLCQTQLCQKPRSLFLGFYSYGYYHNPESLGYLILPRVSESRY